MPCEFVVDEHRVRGLPQGFPASSHILNHSTYFYGKLNFKNAFHVILFLKMTYFTILFPLKKLNRDSILRVSSWQQ